MKTVTINGVEFRVLQAWNSADACDRCDVRNYCWLGLKPKGDYFNACTDVRSGYLKRIAGDSAHLNACCNTGGVRSSYIMSVACTDDSTVKCTNCEELTKKLACARDALQTIHGVYKVHKSETEIKELCRAVLEETK